MYISHTVALLKTLPDHSLIKLGIINRNKEKRPYYLEIRKHLSDNFWVKRNYALKFVEFLGDNDNESMIYENLWDIERTEHQPLIGRMKSVSHSARRLGKAAKLTTKKA